MTSIHTDVFDKTGKGREEITTRQCHLPARLRTLLLLVDGKRGTAELMTKVAGLGLDERSLQELLDENFIARVAEQITPPPSTYVTDIAVATTQTPDSVDNPAPGQEVPPEIAENAPPDTEGAADTTVGSNATAITPTENAPINLPLPTHNILRNGETQFQAVTNFFNETIRNVIGLRGFTLQLKVERAATVADLLALREPYLEAVRKAKGPELERSLRNRLDQLLDIKG